MNSTKIRGVIAERSLRRRGSPRQAVVVSLGRPRRTSGTQDWECVFQIRGAGTRLVEYGRGIDAFQALTMALEGIRNFLDRSRMPLAWPGVLDDHTGFQRVIPLLPEPGGTRRMERLVDRELRQRLDRLKRRHERPYSDRSARPNRTRPSRKGSRPNRP